MMLQFFILLLIPLLASNQKMKLCTYSEKRSFFRNVKKSLFQFLIFWKPTGPKYWRKILILLMSLFSIFMWGIYWWKNWKNWVCSHWVLLVRRYLKYVLEDKPVKRISNRRIFYLRKRWWFFWKTAILTNRMLWNYTIEVRILDLANFKMLVPKGLIIGSGILWRRVRKIIKGMKALVKRKVQ